MKILDYLLLESLSKLFLGDISPLQGGSNASGDSKLGRDSRRDEEVRLEAINIDY